jgi:hypothetical protein
VGLEDHEIVSEVRVVCVIFRFPIRSANFFAPRIATTGRLPWVMLFLFPVGG